LIVMTSIIHHGSIGDLFVGIIVLSLFIIGDGY
jgi:hypothetical protein